MLWYTSDHLCQSSVLFDLFVFTPLNPLAPYNTVRSGWCEHRFTMGLPWGAVTALQKLVMSIVCIYAHCVSMMNDVYYKRCWNLAWITLLLHPSYNDSQFLKCARTLTITKAHNSSVVLLDEKLILVFSFWLKHFVDWPTGISCHGYYSNVNFTFFQRSNSCFNNNCWHWAVFVEICNLFDTIRFLESCNF